MLGRGRRFVTSKFVPSDTADLAVVKAAAAAVRRRRAGVWAARLALVGFGLGGWELAARYWVDFNGQTRFVKPLDTELILELAGRIGKLVTVEENTLSGGFGSLVAHLLQKSGVHDVSVKSIGLPDDFIEHGTQAILRAKYGLDAEGISRQVLSLFPVLDASSVTKSGGKDKALSHKATL